MKRWYIILQLNERAKHADILKSKSGDLKNNIFSAEIEISNLRKNIEGITILYDKINIKI